MPHKKAWVLGEQDLSPYEKHFSDSLRANGLDTTYHNIHGLYPGEWRKLNSYSHRLPRKFDNSLNRKYTTIVNNAVLKLFDSQRPDYVFVYNDCLLTPESIRGIKKAGTKVITFLGDDPNYIQPGKKTFLLTVLYSDAVVVPDSGWIPGLEMLGLKNLIFSPVGTDPGVFRPVQTSSEDLRDFGYDLIFAGTGYFMNAWGIKRAHMLSALSGMNFRLFGDKQWLELLPYFPELRPHYINRPLNADEVNRACNCAKIYPVVVNSGVLNGASTRIFDGAASGIFVLAEYKKDIDLFFPDGEIATFRTREELRDKAEYFLKNEGERKAMADAARKTVNENFTLAKLVGKILDRLPQ